MGIFRRYDGIHLYAGKEEGTIDGTLEERVAKTMTSTVRNPDVTFAFDRFFTSVDLVMNLDYLCVGIYISSRVQTRDYP